MRWLAAAVLVSALAGAARGDSLLSPADAYALAAADIQRVPKSDRPYTLYLWIGHLTRAERLLHVRVLSYQLNSLSRSLKITPPVAITFTPVAQVLFPLTLTPIASPLVLANAGPAKECVLWDTVLLRFDRRNYQDLRGRGFPFKVWERLQFVDPFLHSTATVDWPGGTWSDGTDYKKGAFKYQVTGPAFFTTDTTERKAIFTELRKATGSDTPVIFGDWFLDQTGQQQGRDGHGYYDFLELGDKEKDFQQLVGANPNVVDLFGEIGAIIERSEEVADNNRHIRVQSARGGLGRSKYWYTLDFKTSVKKQNAIRIPDGLDKQADAGRQIGPLPNGLPAFWLQDGKGNRIDVPTGDIANNTRAPSADTQTHLPWTCIACHRQVIINMDDRARQLASIGMGYHSPDPKKEQRLRQLYDTDLQGAIASDVLAYNERTREACGLDAKGLAAAYLQAWTLYHVDSVPLERAQRYWGVPAETILRVLARQRDVALAETAKNGFASDPVDPVLAAYLFTPPKPIRREQFDEVTSVFFLSYKRYGP